MSNDQDVHWRPSFVSSLGGLQGNVSNSLSDTLTDMRDNLRISISSMRTVGLWLCTLSLAAGMSCSAPHGGQRPPSTISPSITGPTGPASEKIDEAKRHVQADLPFEVSIDPGGAIWDGDAVRGGELDHLKLKFLKPLANARYSNKIKRVVIDASSLEWQQWTCSIELDGLPPISLTHFAGFYNGRNNSDPDGYADSRAYSLRELSRIGKLLGWD